MDNLVHSSHAKQLVANVKSGTLIDGFHPSEGLQSVILMSVLR